VKPSSSSSARASLVALAVLAAGFVQACYKPKITDGGFACSSTFKQECPTGYRCVNNRCWSGPVPDASVDRPVDMKMDMPMDVPTEPLAEKPETQPDVHEVQPVCITKPSGCTPAVAGLCDPLCQTGCPGCDQKCSVNTLTGAPTCNAPSAGLVRKVGEGCTPVSPETALQTDNCLPGLVCLPSAACGATCVKFCRTDADCPSSACSRALPGGAKYCDVPTVTCNPVTALASGVTGCAPAQGCYVSSTVADETRCDCPAFSQKEGDDCGASHDCLPGLMCADPLGTSHFVCARACKLDVAAGMPNGCSAPTTCNPVKTPTKTSKTYGFCG
jgi:hypothetical protein